MSAARQAVRKSWARSVLLPAVAAAVVVASVPARADQDSSGMGSNETAGITLNEAVALTLQNNTQLRLAFEGVENRRGITQRADGAFDPVLFSNTDFDWRELELLRSGRDTEIRRRVPAEYSGGWPDPFFLGALDQAANGIDDNEINVTSRCELGQTIVVVDSSAFEDSTVDSGGGFSLCLTPDGRLVSVARSTAFGVGQVLQLTPAGFDLGGLTKLLDLLEEVGKLDDVFLQDQALEQQIESLLELPGELANELRRIAADVRTKRALLGPMPQEWRFLDLRFDVGLRRLFRTGISLSGDLTLVSGEDNFVGKSRDPNRGGSLRPNTFVTSLGLRLVAPLGKNRGSTATAGPSLAAEVLYGAERGLYAHAASQTALDTVNAYWTLAAAQERASLLWESAETQRGILEATRALVDAEEVAGAELSRTEAGYAAALGQFAAAQREIVNARFDLADVMGVQANSLDAAPLAADSLDGTARLAAGEAVEWLEGDLSSRDDLVAAVETTRASGILEATASANLRRQVDFFATLSFNGFHESYSQHLYDFGGFVKAVEGEPFLQPDDPLPQVGLSGPSIAVGLRWSVPFKNRAARGRLVQAEASQIQGQITERDLERTIRLQLQEAVRALARKRDELAQLREAQANYEAALEASLEMYRLGDIPVIDALTSEEQLTDARLGVVDVLQEIAVLEYQTRFEAGRLLTRPDAPERFDPALMTLAQVSTAGSAVDGP